jgi:hypothetical protein
MRVRAVLLQWKIIIIVIIGSTALGGPWLS